MAERKPFHESIVGAIRSATTIEQMRLVDNLINQTKIPKNHDGIAHAWREKMRSWPHEQSLANGVPDCLENQKREVEAEARENEARDKAMLAEETRRRDRQALEFEIEDVMIDRL